MYNNDTELIFPPRVITSLGHLRNEDWQNLVMKVSAPDACLTDRLAFMLLMVRLCGCVTCNSDSFRGMRGCTQCSQQTIKRCRSSNKELVNLYQQAFDEVKEYLLTHSF